MFRNFYTNIHKGIYLYIYQIFSSLCSPHSISCEGLGGSSDPAGAHRYSYILIHTLSHPYTPITIHSQGGGVISDLWRSQSLGTSLSLIGDREREREVEEEEESSRTCVGVIPLGLTSYTKYCNPLSPNSSFLIESSYSAMYH